MKKVFCLLMAFALLGTAGAFAEEAQELPEIDFRGIKLGAALADVQAIMEIVTEPAEGYYGTNLSDILFGRCWIISGGLWEPYSEDPACFLWMELQTWSRLNIGDVAGHEPQFTEMFFVRPVIDGMISADDAKAVFYAGSYTFFDSGGATANDLEAKLTALYGAPEKPEVNKPGWDGWCALVWHGADDTVISLFSNGREVRLSYAWLGAEALIEEARNAYETPAPVDNTGNFNGL